MTLCSKYKKYHYYLIGTESGDTIKTASTFFINFNNALMNCRPTRILLRILNKIIGLKIYKHQAMLLSDVKLNILNQKIKL